MKTLTLTQPHATLVAVGAKRIDTRSWHTNYRGRIAIHAAQSFPEKARDMCWQGPVEDVLHSMGMTIFDLPLGAVIATAELWQILRIDHNVSALLPPRWPELFFGDYRPLRYAWYLRDVRAMVPIAVKGALGLWNWAGCATPGREVAYHRIT